MRSIDYLALVVLACSLAALAVVRLDPNEAKPAAAMSHALRQELPDVLVNAPPDRVPGPDGHPLIDHSAGW